MKKREPRRLPIYKQLIPLIPDKRYLYGLFALKAGLLAAGLITPFFYRMFVDEVLIGGEMALLPLVAAGYAALFAAETGLIFVQRLLNNKCFQLFCARIRVGLLKKYTQMPARDYEAFDAGDLSTRMHSDVTACQDFFGNQIVGYAYHWGVMLAYGAVLLAICWPLALFGFAMVPLSFLLTKTLKKKGGKVSEEYRRHYGQYESYVHTTLQSWREVKALGIEKQETQKFSAHWDILSPLFIKQQVFWYLNRGVIAFKDLFITRMNLYFLGGLLILNGNLSVGGLLVFMMYYETMFASVSAVNDLDINLASQMPSIRRVLEILGRDDRAGRTQKARGFTGPLVLKDVSFAYPGGAPVLRHIDLTIQKGERIAIVGKSGSGKTTLARLMMDVYEPDGGVAALNGVPFTAIEKLSLHRVIGHVAQEPYLFNLTIRENLAMADGAVIPARNRPENVPNRRRSAALWAANQPSDLPQNGRNAGDARLNEVCRLAGIDEFIRSLPNGYDTVIGERGVKLSGGQKQRLALARALLADTPVLIFDEATSALDYETEEKVLQALDAYARGRTVVTIAHRLSAIQSCPRVIVLEDGRMAGEGSHAELMRGCEAYRALFAPPA